MVVPRPTLLLKYVVPLSVNLKRVVDALLTNSTVVLLVEVRPKTENMAEGGVEEPIATPLLKVVLAVPPEANPYTEIIGLPPRYAVYDWGTPAAAMLTGM